MRCHYMSDLHLETQEFPWSLPKGDVLVLAGDLANAAHLDGARTQPYSRNMRDRVLRFADAASRNFTHVLLVAGNHDHYDGVFSETVTTLKRELPSLHVLDDEAVEIGGVCFYGTTLWTDFGVGDTETMNRVRRKLGEYFFVKIGSCAHDGETATRKFTPEDAAAAFERSWQKLRTHLASPDRKPTVVVTHHAPSRQGLNATHIGSGLDCAYASDLDAAIASFDRVPAWIHGHTHIRKSYRIGGTAVLANCRGFDGRDRSANAFKPDPFFDL